MEATFHFFFDLAFQEGPTRGISLPSKQDQSSPRGRGSCSCVQRHTKHKHTTPALVLLMFALPTNKKYKNEEKTTTQAHIHIRICTVLREGHRGSENILPMTPHPPSAICIGQCLWKLRCPERSLLSIWEDLFWHCENVFLKGRRADRDRRSRS